MLFVNLFLAVVYLCCLTGKFWLLLLFGFGLRCLRLIIVFGVFGDVARVIVLL